GARFGQQRRSGIGQLHAARPSPKQPHVELALQRANPLTERRLLHAEPFGRPRDVALLGHGDEIAKVSELHLSYSIRYGYCGFHIMAPRARQGYSCSNHYRTAKATNGPLLR